MKTESESTSQISSRTGRYISTLTQLNLPKSKEVPKDLKSVLILEDQAGVGRVLQSLLEERGIQVLSVTLKPGGKRSKHVLRCSTFREFSEDFSRLSYSFDTLIQLNTLDCTTSLLDLSVQDRERILKTQIYGSLFFMRVVAEMKKAKNNFPQRFMVSTNRGGHFGLRASVPFSEIQGGILGMIRTFSQEVSGIENRVVDFDAKWDRNAIAQALMNELFCENAPQEVGYRDGKRWSQFVLKEDLKPSSQAPLLDTRDVILVSGGARGVTPRLLEDLAKKVPATYLLLGRSAHTLPEELKGSLDLQEPKNANDLKKEIFSILSSRPKPPHPKEVQALSNQVQAYQEIENNLRILRETGARVEYLSLDISDTKSVRSQLPEIEKEFGTITGLIHAAGVLRDGLIETKSENELESVLAPKIDGLLSLLDSGLSKTLRVVCLFSSVAGRFGNPGQADYAAANQILSHLALSQSSANSLCRWIALDWGALEGGMVTKEIAEVFQARGIDLVPLDDAAMAFEKEVLDSCEGSSEIILAPKSSPTLGAKESIPASPVEWEQKLSIHDHFYLKDHVLAEPVLPMAMGMDFMAQASLKVFPHLYFQGIRDLKVFQKISFLEDDQTLVFVVQPLNGSRGLEARVEIFSKDDERTRPRYRAIVELGTRKPLIPSFTIPDGLGFKKFSAPLEELYDQYLFHGKSLRSIAEVSGHSEFGIEGVLKPSKPDEMIQSPILRSWSCDPRILDGMAQLGLIWLGTHKGCIGIPQGLKHYQQFMDFPQEPVRCYVQVAKSGLEKSAIELDFWILSEESQLIAHGQGWEAIFHDSLNAYTTRGKRMAG